MRARWAPRRARGTATRPELRPGPGRRRLLRGIAQLLCGEWSGGIRVGMPRHCLAKFQEGLEAVAQSALLHQFGCALVGFLDGSVPEHQQFTPIAVHVYVKLVSGLAGITSRGV